MEQAGIELEAQHAQFSLHDFVARRIVADGMAIVGIGVFACWFLDAAGLSSAQGAIRQERWLAIAFALCAFQVFARLFQAYSTERILEATYSTSRLAWSLCLTFSLLLFIAAALKTTQEYSRLWFFSWAVASSGLVLILNGLALRRIRRKLDQGGCVHKAITLGIGCAPVSAEAIAAQTRNEVRVLACLQLDSPEKLPRIADRVKRSAIEKVYITAPWQDVPDLIEPLQSFRNLALDVLVFPKHARLDEARSAGQILNEVALVAATRPLEGWKLWQKRALDVCVATLALVVASPVMLLIALAIKIESPGPILFRQKRAGFNDSAFECWKFRSMYWERRDLGAQTQTAQGDARVTRVGRFIRRTSLDELPQFFNVLQGRMSVVGPRPHALATSAEGRLLGDLLDEYAARHRVKPGMTGWAQVNGLRGAITSVDLLQKRVAHDLDYIERWSLLFDLRIILKTIRVIIYDQNAF